MCRSLSVIQCDSGFISFTLVKEILTISTGHLCFLTAALEENLAACGRSRWVFLLQSVLVLPNESDLQRRPYVQTACTTLWQIVFLVCEAAHYSETPGAQVICSCCAQEQEEEEEDGDRPAAVDREQLHGRSRSRIQP
ncbi:hypothetical protein IRJ41_020506 [Triplophysa rosa]|uniref:Uncharacterized protein n=1 Tax=Triplophysa rosa TaxID=992332 RepID=A0A9W7TFK0_TRIRA|nr:hypothetical protein IRJ41_020506 [Triplophysa rosa]